MTTMIVKSPVYEVVMRGGFRTTTTQLQAGGWELAISRDPVRWAMSLSAYHPDYMVAISSAWVDLDTAMKHHMWGGISPVDRGIFVIERIYTKDMKFRGGPPLVFAAAPIEFMPFDARPAAAFNEEFSFEDMTKLFRPILVPEEKELIVDPQSVDSLMNQILSLQKRKQAELRRKAADTPRVVHAQLVSLAA